MFSIEIMVYKQYNDDYYYCYFISPTIYLFYYIYISSNFQYRWVAQNKIKLKNKKEIK